MMLRRASVYDLIYKPEVFGTGEFDFFFVWFLFPVEEEDESVAGSNVNYFR